MKTTEKTAKVNFTKLALLVLALLVNLMLPGCLDNKDNPEPTPDIPSPDPVPSAKVPDLVAGKWMMGNFSMGDFWKYDGSYVGNAFELGVAFDFKKNGQCEFYLATGGTSYSCRTEAFVYKKGKVEFNDNESFTFYPSEGNTRGFYKGCASSYQNYNRPYDRHELKPEIYYYSLEKNSSGKNMLLIRFKQTDASASTFQPVNW